MNSQKEVLLNISMYKFLLGTLSKKEVGVLKEELAERFQSSETNSALERRLHEAFSVDRATRDYLNQSFDEWEKNLKGRKSVD